MNGTIEPLFKRAPSLTKQLLVHNQTTTRKEEKRKSQQSQVQRHKKVSPSVFMVANEKVIEL